MSGGFDRRGPRRGEHADTRGGTRSIAPGKATRTGKLARAVQRRPRSASGPASNQGQPADTRPLHDWTNDPALLAAHGFAIELDGQGAAPGKKAPAAPVQARPAAASASPRVAVVEDGPLPDAVVIVVARKRGAEVARWSGPMDWYWELPMRFTGKRTRGGWQWSDAQAASMGIRSPERRGGGVPVTQWAREHGATEIEILLVSHPGRPEADAGADGFGTQGQGTGGDARSEAEHAESGDGLDATPAGGAGLGAQGEGLGAGRGGDLARAGSADGYDRGDARGSEEPSWVQDTGAELDMDGGRTPTEHGRRGGSAGGSPDGTGHVDGAGWLNVLDVPGAVAPAVNVAVILADANIAGAGERLFRQAVKKISGEVLGSAVEREVKRGLRRALKREERRLRKVRGLGKSERARILGEAHDALERGFRERLAAHARERAAESEALVARLADRTDDVSARARELAQENAAAYHRIEATASPSTPAGQGRAADAGSSAPQTQRAGGEAASSARAGLPGETVAVQRVRLAGSEHAVRAQRIGDDVQVWLCSDCGRMVDKIDAALAQVADHGPTKSLHRRLVKLRDKLQSAESRLAAGALPREDLHRELNQIGAHLRDLSQRHPQLDELCFFESLKATKLAPEEAFDVAAFEKSLVGLSPGERVARVRETADKMAKKYGWRRDRVRSELNDRVVYSDNKSKRFYAVDTQHGRLEVNHFRSGKHLGEVDFDLKPTKPADRSGGHDLRVK